MGCRNSWLCGSGTHYNVSQFPMEIVTAGALINGHDFQDSQNPVRSNVTVSKRDH